MSQHLPANDSRQLTVGLMVARELEVVGWSHSGSGHAEYGKQVVLGYQEVHGEMSCSSNLHKAVEEGLEVTLAVVVERCRWERREQTILQQAKTGA